MKWYICNYCTSILLHFLLIETTYGTETIKVAVVCSKEFGDIFHHDRHMILNNLTAYFWDISARFRTLANSNIVFRVNSVKILEGQEFLASTYLPDGKLNETVATLLFSQWIVEQGLPKFDIAITVYTSTSESYDERSFINNGDIGACTFDGAQPKGVGMLRWHPSGSFQLAGSLILGRLLGIVFGPEAPAKTCTGLGYIDNANFDPTLRHFFSSNGDGTISRYIQGPNCQQERDTNADVTHVELDPDFDNVMVTRSIQEECQSRLNIFPDAIVPPEDLNICTKVRCRSWNNDKEIAFSPLDNMNCGEDRRCFRGACIEPGSLLVNMGNGDCMEGGSRFSTAGDPRMVTCPRSSNPTNRFKLVKAVGNSFLLATYLMNVREATIREKCLEARRFVLCSRVDSNLLWNVEKVGNGEVILKHVKTGACAAQEENSARVVLLQCNKEDRYFRWKFHKVYPSSGMCKNNICTSNLKLRTSFILDENTRPNTTIVMNVTMMNSGEPAISPAVTISWNSSVKLIQEPGRCVVMGRVSNGLTSYRCKLGRLLATDETAKFDPLRFHVADTLLKNNFNNDTSSDFELLLSASTASNMVRKESISMKFPVQTSIYMTGSSVGTVSWEKSSVVFQQKFQIRLDDFIQVPNITAIFELPHSINMKNHKITITATEGSLDTSQPNFRAVGCNPVNYHIGASHPDPNFNYDNHFVSRVVDVVSTHLAKNSKREKNMDASFYDNNTDTVEISCNNQKVECSTVICHFDRYTPGLVSTIQFQLSAPYDQIESLRAFYNATGVRVESIGLLELPDAVKKLQSPKHADVVFVSAVTFIDACGFFCNPWLWIYIGSGIAGCVLLLIVVCLSVLCIRRNCCMGEGSHYGTWTERIKQGGGNRQPPPATAGAQNTPDMKCKPLQPRYVPEPKWSEEEQQEDIYDDNEEDIYDVIEHDGSEDYELPVVNPPVPPPNQILAGHRMLTATFDHRRN